jgi:hypothetical protein
LPALSLVSCWTALLCRIAALLTHSINTTTNSSLAAYADEMPAGQRYKGVHYVKKKRKSSYHHVGLLNPVTSSMTYLGRYTSACEVTNAAKHYDCAQILLRGSAATTNFSIGSYTQADVAAAAVWVKEAAGWDVQKAVEAAQQRRGTSTYSGVRRGTTCASYTAMCSCSELKTLGSALQYYCGSFTAEAEAARAVDLNALVLNGLQAKLLNFPAALYSVQQLDSTHQALVGWVAGQPASQEAKQAFLATIQGNVDAVKQASC